MLAYSLYSLQQIARGIRFHNVTPGPRIQGLAHHLRRIMLSNEQNLEARVFPLLLNQTTRFQTIHLGHGDIEHDYIGLQTLDFDQGLDPVRRFSDNFPARPALQQSPQPLPYDGMIIHQKYADCHEIFLGFLRQPRTRVRYGSPAGSGYVSLPAGGVYSHQAEKQRLSESPKNTTLTLPPEYRESCIFS
jgi:hypothetical protein